MEEKNITLKELRENLSIIEEYEVWDEKLKKWVDYRQSCYCTDSSFPQPNEAKYPINLITIYNSLDSKFYTWGTKKYTPQDPDVVYFYCKTEAMLVEKFMEFWENDPPDVLVGWNSSGFDIPYMMNRFTNLFGEEFTKRFSPVQEIYYRENVGINKFGKVIDRWYIRGLSHIDYMEAYKTFARGERESYSLGYIGQFELGETKVNIGATSLSTLSDTDWDKFVEYNIQDVRLLVKLDASLKYINLIKTLSYKGFIPFESSMGKVSMITGAIAHQASLDGKVISTFKRDDIEMDYVGGYVHDPERGITQSVVSYDANSLYPNTIITLNVSPETKIGKILSVNEGEYTLALTNNKVVSLPEEKFNRLVEKELLTISKYNILHTQKFKGVVPKFIDRLYSERVDAKNKMFKLKKQLKNFKDPKDKAKINEKISDLDTIQYTYKILLNSIYGVFGQKYSPLYDVDHAASITLTGQAVVKQASDIVYEFAVSKGVTCKKEDIYKYGDTDSAYFSIQPILNHMGISLLDENKKITEEVRTLTKEIGEYLNTEIVKWSESELKSNDGRFLFKQEALCDVGVFLEKKRYILHVLELEGVETDKPFKYVGVEVVRSSFSDPIKDLIKNVIESAILSQNKKDSDNILKQAYETFCTMPIEDVAFRSKISDIDKQLRKIGSDGKIGLGTPVHAKGAIYYNNMLEHFDLQSKYEKITSGTKIKWFYASKNQFNFSVLSFLDEFPNELKPVFSVNHMAMFEKSVIPPVERFYRCIGWDLPPITLETCTDLFELFA